MRVQREEKRALKICYVERKVYRSKKVSSGWRIYITEVGPKTVWSATSLKQLPHYFHTAIFIMNDLIRLEL